MPHTQALASTHMSDELQNVFQAVIWVVNCVKKGSIRARLFAKLCDGMAMP
jgi:hypothetical protein